MGGRLAQKIWMAEATLSDDVDPLSAFIAFAKKKKKGFLLMTPKSGKAPVSLQFGAKAIPGEGAKGQFHYQDKVIYLEDGFDQPHAKGLQKTLKDDGWFTLHVVLEGQVVDIEGSDFDKADDEWQAMKKVLNRHPMSVAVQKRYDRVEQLLKAAPPDVSAIQKAMRVLDQEVARLKTKKGGHGETAEIQEKGRINDKSKIAEIRNIWARMERKVRTAPMTRPVREDLALMEKLIASPAPDEKALTATYERLTDFLRAVQGKAATSAASSGDAKAKAAKQLLIEWQKTIQPNLNKLIAHRVRSRGEGAPEANKLAALAKQFTIMLQGESPDLDRAKKTFALFAAAHKDMSAAKPAS